MNPYYTDDWLTIYGGDCRAVLRELPAESVHCVITSPPYWGLRDYGTATWEGGDAECDHRNWPGTATGNKGAVTSTPMHGACTRCGARRIDSQLGLEPTPEEYVAAMVGVFREVRRVLRADGTLWLNLGDSYAAGPMTAAEQAGKRSGGTLNGRYGAVDNVAMAQRRSPVTTGLKPKDLVGIPWRVAFALQADGWYLRSDIIWSKPNPMPESVTDRPTKSHEYLFLLAKSARYYFDADAVREAHQWPGGSVVERGVQAYATAKAGPHGQPDRGNSGGFPITTAGRNIRSVWTIATAPYPGAHFATFPPKLVEPCVKAGCPPDGVVMDPFAGTGTVGMVAQSLSRRAVLIDLNPDYLRQCLARNAQTPMGLPA